MLFIFVTKFERIPNFWPLMYTCKKLMEISPRYRMSIIVPVKTAFTLSSRVFRRSARNRCYARLLRSRHRSKRCINQPGKKLGKWFFAFACEPVNKNRRFIGVVHGRSNNQRNLWRALHCSCVDAAFRKLCPPPPPQNRRVFFSLSFAKSHARKVLSARFFFISFQFRGLESKYEEGRRWSMLIFSFVEDPGLIC